MMLKSAIIRCTLEFIEIITKTACGMSYYDPLGEDFYFPLDADLNTLGSSLISALEKSRYLSSSPEERKEFSLLGKMNKDSKEWYVYLNKKWLDNKPERKLFAKELVEEREQKRIENILANYKYRSQRALFKNMQACSVADERDGIRFFSHGNDESNQ